MSTVEKTVRYLYFLFAVCFLGGVFGGISSTLMSAYLPIVLNDLTGSSTGEEAGEIGAILNAAYLFGMMFGGLSMGVFSDRFGRKPAVLFSIGFIGLFMCLTVVSGNWTMVGAFRFLTGFGVGGVLVSSATLVAEEWHDRGRKVILGILSITIPVGIFSAGLITYNVADWRTGFLIGMVPLLLAIVGQFTLHESDRWLEHRARFIENRQKKTAIFNPEIASDLIIGSLIYGSMLIGLWAVFAWLPTWVQTLVTGSDGQKERGLSMMLFAIGGLSGGFISGWTSNRFGVKRTLLVCFAATFLMTFLLFKMNTELTVLVYAEMAIIALFFGLSQGVLNGWIPELFPTDVRSAATGFCFNIGRVFTASVVFFVGWLEVTLGGIGNALFIFSFVFLIGLIITLFAKEKNRIAAGE